MESPPKSKRLQSTTGDYYGGSDTTTDAQDFQLQFDDEISRWEKREFDEER
jgi:hypothetical protein